MPDILQKLATVLLIIFGITFSLSMVNIFSWFINLFGIPASGLFLISFTCLTIAGIVLWIISKLEEY